MHIFVLAVLWGCGPDVSVGKVSTDADSDGYDSTVDCNDGRASVHPEADELCDGIDNDCDGTVDEDPLGGERFYVDVDGDGYGDAEVVACEPSDGLVSEGGDCDDADSEVHPGAPEEDCEDPVDYNCDGSVAWADADGDGSVACIDCDDTDAERNPGAVERCDEADVDEDCDGQSDEAGATGESTWYADGDGDGWAADDGATVAACDAPVGYAAERGDCDDTDPAVNPLGAEICDDADADEDCDGLVDDDDPSVTGGLTWYRDADGDNFAPDGALTSIACAAPTGFVADGGDCDDADPTVSPDAAEVCDDADRDEDCDGVADDGDASTDASTWTTWYRDADADGWGDASRTVVQCDAPTGYVADGTDCDDADGAAHPLGTEICDAADADEDCDGLADDADPSAEGASPAFTDADADGYGDPATEALWCDPPADAALLGTDCDDADDTVHPGGTETCDGIDEDCDGAVDDGATDGTTWYPDLDLDGFGDASGATVVCEPPSGYVADGDDCDDGDAGISPAGAEVCDDGIDQDCSGRDRTCPFTGGYGSGSRDAVIFETTASASLPYSLDRAGDVNADGYEDLVIANEYDSTTDLYQGSVLVFEGPIAGARQADSADAILLGISTQDRIREVSWVGDVNGDGLDDILAGSYLVEPSGLNREGAAYLVLSPVSGTASLSTADGEWYGGASEARAGSSLTGAGDLDEDGFGDLALGCWGNGTCNYVSVFRGPATGTHVATGGDFVLTGETALDGVGTVAGGEDLDGDGLDDLLVGAFTASTWGAVYPVLSPISTMSLSGAYARYTGSSTASWLGAQVLLPGDLDGDGYADMVAAASYSGVVFVLYGPPPASGSIESLAEATIATTLWGVSSDFGRAGDVDDDGADELLVSDITNDSAGTDRGRVGLFFAPVGSLAVSTAATYYYGDTNSDAAGRALGAGDFDGDGSSDVAIGVHGDDYGASDGGSVWIFSGGR